MIITKKHLARRTVLRGLGATRRAAAARRHGAGAVRRALRRPRRSRRFGAIYVGDGLSTCAVDAAAGRARCS